MAIRAFNELPANKFRMLEEDTYEELVLPKRPVRKTKVYPRPSLSTLVGKDHLGLMDEDDILEELQNDEHIVYSCQLMKQNHTGKW